MSENSLATFKTPAENSGSAIGASLVASLVRLGTDATASTYTFDWVVFLASETSGSEFRCESVVVGVGMVREPVLQVMISSLKSSC